MSTLRNPELFSYVTAFVTIVLAIALSDLLMSLHRLIRARRRVAWSFVPLLAAGFVFVLILSEFFSIWVVANVDRISFVYLVLLVAVSSTGAIAAFVVLPDEVPVSGLDLWQAYLEDRAYLFGVMSAGTIGDVLRTFAHAYLIHGTWPNPHDLLLFDALSLLSLAVLALLAWSKDRRVHVAGLLALYGIAAMGIVGWTVGRA